MPSSELLTVRGAELIRVAGAYDRRPAPLSVRERVWRRIEPAPLFLADGESFLLATRMHGCVPVKIVARAVAFMQPSMIIGVLVNILLGFFWQLWVAVGLITVGHILHTGYKLLEHYAKLLVVTSRRMYVSSGLVNCTLQDVKLQKIEHFKVDRSWIGRILGYGHLRIETAGVHDDGAKRELYLFVPAPMEVYNAAQIGRWQ